MHNGAVNAEGRRQKAEGRKQKAESKRQKAHSHQQSAIGWLLKMKDEKGSDE
jgi:hypothetical protein